MHTEQSNPDQHTYRRPSTPPVPAAEPRTAAMDGHLRRLSRSGGPPPSWSPARSRDPVPALVGGFVAGAVLGGVQAWGLRSAPAARTAVGPCHGCGPDGRAGPSATVWSARHRHHPRSFCRERSLAPQSVSRRLSSWPPESVSSPSGGPAAQRPLGAGVDGQHRHRRPGRAPSSPCSAPAAHSR